MPLPAILGGIAAKGAIDLAGDAIEGAGSAIGGIAKGIGSAVGGIAQGAGAALGGALQGALTDPDVVINNFGMAGGAAKARVKTTATINFNSGNVEKLDYSEQMPLEKLMVVAIKYLQGISKSIKNQGEYEAKLSRKQALLDRENIIENNSPTEQLDNISGSKKKDKSGNISSLLKGLGAGAAILAASTIDMSDLEKLGENLKQFQEKYGWMIDIAVYGSMAGYLLKIPGLGKLVWNIVKSGGAAAAEAVVKGATFLGATGIVSAAGAVGVVAGGIYAINKWTNDEGQKSVTFADQLKSKYNMKVNQEQTSIGMVTKSITIGDKTYKPGELPADYQEIYDSYSGSRGASSKADVDKKHSKLAVKEGKASGKTGYANDIYQFFASRGYTDAQAKGIAAGIQAESKSDHNVRGGYKGRAVGLGQWLGPRRDELFRRYGETPTRQQQLEFLDYELKGGDIGGKAVLAQNTEAGALSAYINKFMRPAKGSETTKDMQRGMTALGRGGEDIPGSDSVHGGVGGAMEAAGALVADSFDAVIDAVKKIGSTDTTFKPNLTTPAPKFNKTDKLIEDSVKFQAEIDLGKKEDVKKNQTIRGDTSSGLRRMNGGVLDVIDPNYKMDKNSILTSYIMNFKETMA